MYSNIAERQDKAGLFELHPYKQIQVVESDTNIRAFIFKRLDKTYVAYWHTLGYGNIELNVDGSKVNLFKKLGKAIKVRRIRRKNNNSC